MNEIWQIFNYLNYFVPDHQHPVPGGPAGDVPVQGVLGEDPPAGGADQDRGWVRGQHQEVRLNIFHCTSLNIFRVQVRLSRDLHHLPDHRGQGGGGAPGPGPGQRRQLLDGAVRMEVCWRRFRDCQ